MPTPVSHARQCLATEAAAALDDAVAVARRRANAQTTSLHVVYALLSSPSSSSAAAPGGGGGGASSSASNSSILRDALSRARSSAYSPRLQFKALELCFGVALDRLPSSSSSSSHHQGASAVADEPPVSNSLMAAIKRSQANQRRNPDTFHLYQQQQLLQQQSGGGASSFSGVKVELQQLVLAILDDPIVSRVFGDAGFRSTDIKLAVLRPPLPILRFPRASRCPPLFLCNFSTGDAFESALSPRGLVFPFAAAPGQLCSDGGDENCRRIGEILARKSGSRNPMLIGASAGKVALDFAQAVERQRWAELPSELRGIKLVSIEQEVAELGTGGGDRLAISSRLEELARNAEAPGVVLSIGDLKGMVEGSGEGDGEQSFIVSELTRVLEVHRARLWVMGWSATYENYMKFLLRYPLLDKDWNLQLMPIASTRAGVNGSLSRPSSLMESFVPFGGLFPATYESKDLLSRSYPLGLRCKYCNEKYEQEVAIILREHSIAIEDHQKEHLPSWLRKTNICSANDGVRATKAKDDMTVLHAKILDLQKKWSDCCQRLHHSCQTISTHGSEVVQCTIDPLCVSGKVRASNHNNETSDDTQNQRVYGISFPTSMGPQKISMVSQSISLPSDLEPRNKYLVSELQVRPSKSEELQREGFQPQQVALRDLGHHDDHASPSSVTSIMTNLVLGTAHEQSCKEQKSSSQRPNDSLEDLSGCMLSAKVDMIRRNYSEVLVESGSYSGCPDSQGKKTEPLTNNKSVSKVSIGQASAYDQPSFLLSNSCQNLDVICYKSFCANLAEKVGRQEEAVSAISQAVICCKTGERPRGSSLKGDIWLSFQGPDRFGKKRVAMALAEMIYGSKENLISIDLSYETGITRPCTICNQQEVNGFDVKFRGKTTVDYIAAELSKRPRSIIFLENMDKADSPVQKSLSQAIRTGKFPDSHGREFSIDNTIFVLTSTAIGGKRFSHRKDSSTFFEESILEAQCWQMKISIEPSVEAVSISRKANVLVSPRLRSSSKQVSLCSMIARKRKLDASEDCESPHEFWSSAKRAHKSSKTFLDLNLPVEEVEVNDADSNSNEVHYTTDVSEAWMEEFLHLVDARVDFKPYDFDALAKSILKDLSQSFCAAVGTDCQLEIDIKVMEQILAAAWSLEDRGPLNNWLDRVLGRSFTELNHRYNLSIHNVVRLVCEDALFEHHAPGVLLPSKLILD